MNTQHSNRKWLLLVTGWLAFALATEVSARPAYVEAAGASACTDCHLSPFGGDGWKPGVLDAFDNNGIQGLRDFLAAKKNTPPRLSAINPKWDVTVGELPLTIPLQVTDKEDDTFSVHGTAPKGYTTSKVYIRNNLPTVDFTWRPTAAQANKTYPLKLFVRETGAGRTLESNTVTANVQVWPARNSSTKNVSLFMLQSAQWRNNRLNLSGQLQFKANLSAAQRTAALGNLTMSITSPSGAVISQPIRLAPGTNGTWTRAFNLNANEVPCSVRVSYEGLRAARQVNSAPAGTCVK
jgi:hypothetical protein